MKMRMKNLLLPVMTALLVQGCTGFDPEENSSIEDDVIISYPSLDTLKSDSSLIISRSYYNWEGQSGYYAKNSSDIEKLVAEYDYWVLCSDSLIEFSQKLIAYRKQNPHDVVEKGCIISINDLRKMFTPNELNLKSFFNSLKRHIDTTKDQYVVLVGNTDQFDGIPLPIENGDSEYFENFQNILHGRIPVINNSEGDVYLNKLIETERLLSKEIVHIADDQWQNQSFDNIDFQKIVMPLDSTLKNRGWNSSVIALESFAHDTLGFDMTDKAPLDSIEIENVKETIINTFNNQYGFINFNGHSSDVQWTDENVFNLENSKQLTTNSLIFSTSRAYNMESGERTLVEHMFVARYGIVGFIGPSHTMTYVGSHSEFVNNLFTNIENTQSLGELSRMTTSMSTRNRYTLMGDPAFSLKGIRE